jgi:hypothetical protein
MFARRAIIGSFLAALRASFRPAAASALEGVGAWGLLLAARRRRAPMHGATRLQIDCHRRLGWWQRVQVCTGANAAAAYNSRPARPSPAVIVRG